MNGRFETGDFSGWTTYALDGGTIGSPTAVLTDVLGPGSSPAARFQVGSAGTALGPRLGGGLSQSLTLSEGTYQFSIDLASRRPIAMANVDGGRFELIVDGVVRASHDFGYLAANATGRATLEKELVLTAGEHEIRLQWTRTFRGDDQTPYQFMGNAALTPVDVPGNETDPVGEGGEGTVPGDPNTIANPVPGGVVLFGLGLATLGAGRLVRRRVTGA